MWYSNETRRVSFNVNSEIDLFLINFTKVATLSDKIKLLKKLKEN